MKQKPWMDGDRLIGFEVKGEAFLEIKRRMANALFRLAVGELQEHDIAQAIDQPLVSVDFGVAPPHWLVLWGVVWEHAPLPEQTHQAVFSPRPPSNGGANPQGSMAAGCTTRTEEHALQRMG